jgi:hypothetical protein
MNWLAFLVAILKTVAEISNYLGGRQLIEAGKAKALSDGLALTLANVEKANEAAAAVDDPNSAHSVRVRERYERTGQQDE